MTYVRAGLPPVIAIHGDADPIVPYEQEVREIDALKKAGGVAELVTIPAGDTGTSRATRCCAPGPRSTRS